MYLEHFKFKELPFTLTPNTQFFCQLKGHQEALNTLLFALRSGEGFIKIIGEVGSGKTLLCRKLLDSLEEDFVTAYIPNPHLNPVELRKTLARELGVKFGLSIDPHELLLAINEKLLKLHSQGKHVVLLVDEAQALYFESLETLRLLTNLETETHKLLQVALFAQPELDERLKSPNLRQLAQRITFSYYLPKLSRDDLDTYLFHRLAVAGYTYGALFSKKATDALYNASKGIPRLINILCHKALLVSYGQGSNEVTRKAMLSAIKDTYPISKLNRILKIALLVLAGFAILMMSLITIFAFKGIA